MTFVQVISLYQLNLFNFPKSLENSSDFPYYENFMRISQKKLYNEFVMIKAVDESNIKEAGYIHSVSWKESHKAFCTPEFIAEHTTEHQTEYLKDKINAGSVVYMLIKDFPVGIVSIKENLIEDLYVLPNQQKKGYGTELIKFAIKHCSGVPTLWILNNNSVALKLYLGLGFSLTGKRNNLKNGFSEIELSLR